MMGPMHCSMYTSLPLARFSRLSTGRVSPVPQLLPQLAAPRTSKQPNTGNKSLLVCHSQQLVFVHAVRLGYAPVLSMSVYVSVRE